MRGAPVLSIAAIGLFVMVPLLAHAQSDEADRRFKEAEALLAAGKVAEACDAFEASNRIEPSAGTLINVGLCKEKLGKLGSALAAYRAALERVKDPKKKAIATERAAALEPRVSRLRIAVAAEARVEGLAVTRDGERVEADDYDRPVPVDGGSYEIAASAPGYRKWSTTIEVRPEGDKASVEVPKLVEKEPAAPVETAPAPRDQPAGKGTHRTAFKATGYGLVGVAFVSMSYAMYLTVAGPIPAYEDLRSQPINPDTNMETQVTSDDCGATLGRRVREVKDNPVNVAYDHACNASRTRMIAAVVGLISGAASIPLLYFAYRSEGAPAGKQSVGGRRARRELAVTPVIGPTGAGAIVRLAW